jgi:hypothetical protein
MNFASIPMLSRDSGARRSILYLATQLTRKLTSLHIKVRDYTYHRARTAASKEIDFARRPHGSCALRLTPEASAYRTSTLNRKMPPSPGFTGCFSSQRRMSEPTSFVFVSNSASTLLLALPGT